MEATKALKTALGAHAEFEDAQIRRATFQLLDALDSDLNYVGLDISDECSKAISDLQDLFEEKLEEEEVEEEVKQEEEDRKVEEAADDEIEEAVKEADEDEVEDDEFTEEDFKTDEELE